MATATPVVGTQVLYTWNLATPRMPLFDPSQRFDDYQIAPRKGNQYSINSFEEDFNNSYCWLVKSTKVVASSPAGHYQCWIPEGTGIQPMASGYNRFSFRGVYYMCHVFVWHYHNPNQAPGQGVSHLCSNENCCRPSHLYDENRNYNVSRRGCLGYLVSSENSELVIRVCVHDPPCTRTTSFSENSNIVTLNYE